MDLCRIYADFCIYAVAFLLSFLIFVCELNFAEYMRRPIINEKLPISESNPIKARHTIMIVSLIRGISTVSMKSFT